MAKYSKAKIAKTFIRANVNFWGGRNIPALQSLMNFALDPKSVLDNYKIEPKLKNTTTVSVNEINKLYDEAAQEEEKLEQLRRGFAKLITSLIGIEMMIVAIDPNAFLPRSIYNLTSTIINSNKLDKKLVPHVFYAIDVATIVDREILKKYAEGIVKLRKLDQDIRNQDSKAKQKYNQYMQKVKMAQSNINKQKKKK